MLYSLSIRHKKLIEIWVPFDADNGRGANAAEETDGIANIRADIDNYTAVIFFGNRLRDRSQSLVSGLPELAV